MLTGFSVSLTNPDYTAEDGNDMDPALPDWRQACYAENYLRLVQIKDRYDPHRFFQSAQSIG